MYDKETETEEIKKSQNATKYTLTPTRLWKPFNRTHSITQITEEKKSNNKRNHHQRRSNGPDSKIPHSVVSRQRAEMKIITNIEMCKIVEANR